MALGFKFSKVMKAKVLLMCDGAPGVSANFQEDAPLHPAAFQLLCWALMCAITRFQSCDPEDRHNRRARQGECEMDRQSGGSAAEVSWNLGHTQSAQRCGQGSTGEPPSEGVKLACPVLTVHGTSLRQAQ